MHKNNLPLIRQIKTEKNRDKFVISFKYHKEKTVGEKHFFPQQFFLYNTKEY